MTFDEAMKGGHLKAPVEPSLADKAASYGESGLRGFANAATFGMAPKISAGVNTVLGKVAPDVFGSESYDTRLKDYLAADRAAEDANPITSLAASAIPTAIQAVATGGGSLARQAGTNAALGAVNAYGNSEATNPLNMNVATGAGVAGALTAAPGLIGKGIGKVADSVSRGTVKQGVTDVNRLIREKEPGWQDAVASRLGMPKYKGPEGDLQKMDFGDISPDMIRNYLNKLASGEKSLGGEFAGATKDVLKANTPSGMQVAKDAVKTAGYGALGAGGAAGVNYLTGGNVDPATAVMIGGGLGAQRAGSDLFKHAGTKAAHAISTTDYKPLAAKYASRPVGAATQMGVQAATKEIGASSGLESSPFGTLSDYLSAYQTADDKRKAAMDLETSPEGRAIGNTDSTLRK